MPFSRAKELRTGETTSDANAFGRGLDGSLPQILCQNQGIPSAPFASHLAYSPSGPQCETHEKRLSRPRSPKGLYKREKYQISFHTKVQNYVSIRTMYQKRTRLLPVSSSGSSTDECSQPRPPAERWPNHTATYSRKCSKYVSLSSGSWPKTIIRVILTSATSGRHALRQKPMRTLPRTV